MKLYYSPGACSLAPHIALREAGRRFDLERVELHTQRTASGRSLYDVNPKGEVPILELGEHGDTRLTETQVILQYIADRAPEKVLVPPHGAMARYRLLEWLAFFATAIQEPFRPLRGEHGRGNEVQRGLLCERLSLVDEALATRAFLLGDLFSIGDAYLFTLLQWCEPCGIDLEIWPALDAYEQRLATRPTVAAAMAAEGLAGRHDAAHRRRQLAI